MSCQHKRNTSLLLFILLSVAFHIGHSIKVPRGKVSSYLNGWQSKNNPEKHTDSEQAARGKAPGHRPGRSGVRFPKDIEAKVKEIAKSLERNGRYYSPQAWTYGNVSTSSTHNRQHINAGYQADSAGVQSVRAGKVLGPSFDSSTLVPEWLAMRPLVECNDNIMTLTTTGQGYTHLLVRREHSTPISPFQLPPYCGYSVSTSWRDLVMTAPYDGCYITQENGSYVLPMQWWGAPLKLSCPVPPPPPSPLGVVLLCASYGMVLHLYNGEEGICSSAWAVVNGEWDPLASTLCAYPLDIRPGQCLYFIPLGAPCVTVGDGAHLQLLLNKQQFILSCPDDEPQLSPYFPSPPYSQPSFPGDPQYPYSPGSGATEAPSKPPQPTPPPPPPPTPQPATQHSQGPPAPRPSHLPRPSPGAPSGGQSSQSPHIKTPGQSPYSPVIDPNRPSRPSTQSPHQKTPGQSPYSPGIDPNRPSRPSAQSPHQKTPGLSPYFPGIVPNIPSRPSTQSPHQKTPGQLPYSPGIDPNNPSRPSVPDYPASTWATQAPRLPTGPPNYPVPPTRKPSVQGPPTSAPQLPKQPLGPQYPLPQYPPSYPPYYGPYYPEYYPQTPTIDHYYPYGYWPVSPPAKGPPHDSQNKQPSGPGDTAVPPVVQPAQPYGWPMCPPNAHAFCSYYYPYHGWYPSLQYPSMPLPPYDTATVPPSPTPKTEFLTPRPTRPGIEYPVVTPESERFPTSESPTTITTSTPKTRPYIPPATTTQPPPQLVPQCMAGRMMLALPSADPGSIRVRVKTGSNVKEWCKYMLEYTQGHGVILHSPRPSCPGPRSTTTVLLAFKDLVVKKYRSLTVECPYQGPTEPPVTTPRPTRPGIEYPVVTPESERFPASESPTTITTSTPKTRPYIPPATTTQPPLQLVPQCMAGRMMLALPSADPGSIRVRVKTGSNVKEWCKYMLEYTQGHGVILHSPHPSCPGPQSTTTVLLGFKDLVMKKYRSLTVECPYQGPTEPPVTSPPSTPPTIIPRPKVYCSAHRMTVELPPGLIAGIVVKDANGNQMKLQDAPEHCGYFVSKEKDGRIILKLPLNSDCHMSVQGTEHLVNIVYTTMHGRREAQLSCPVSVPVPHTECNLPSDQRLPCGSNSWSQRQCLTAGCCFSTAPPACYYPMDECTMDRHFVFSVPLSLNGSLLSSASLVAGNNSSCTPRKVTRDYALFKIPMDGCGAVRLEVGKTVIYMVEITNVIQSVTLNYGTITRDTPVRLLVECRYLPGSVVSAGYLVKSPTLGSPIHSQGIFGVQLRIANDSNYSNYYPEVHRPLRKLLREPLHLELRVLNSPDPDLVLLVHYCVAYPRSGHSAWVILYNGCPNPLDPAPQQRVLPPPSPPSSQKQIRRFTISTFKFLNHVKTAGRKTADRKTDDNNNTAEEEEEIYFMCSTEVCSPLDGPCVEGCFGQ